VRAATVHQTVPTCPRCAQLALRATSHCLTGCAIGEVLGLALATAFGLANAPSIGLAVVLAFFFGYSLTMWPLLRSGLPLAAAVSAAVASDTVSIVIMEIVDNAFMLLVPGAMEAGLGDILFWGSLAGGLAVAFVPAYLAALVLIRRGVGHATLHAYHQ
jgi:hypothetical protein